MMYSTQGTLFQARLLTIKTNLYTMLLRVSLPGLYLNKNGCQLIYNGIQKQHYRK